MKGNIKRRIGKLEKVMNGIEKRKECGYRETYRKHCAECDHFLNGVCHKNHIRPSYWFGVCNDHSVKTPGLKSYSSFIHTRALECGTNRWFPERKDSGCRGKEE